MVHLGYKFDTLMVVTSEPSSRPNRTAKAAKTESPGLLPGDAGRTIARLARQVETALGEVDLSPSQYRALAFLSEDGAASAATALAGRMSVSKPSITALVDGLVQRGLVERRGSEQDRRRVEHLLTDDGRAVLGRADHAVNARLALIAGHLAPDDRSQAGQGLEQWAAALMSARAALLARP
jgi:long-chain acyl-CoA synthetase